MAKTPFRAWRERNDLTQAQAAKILDRSKRSVEMLDQATTLSPELDYACRWIGRYVILEQFAPVADRLLGHAQGDASDYVQDCAADSYYHKSQDDKRIAAAEAALQKLKNDKVAAQEDYEEKRSALIAWLERVDKFVETEEPLCDLKELPTLPSRTISTADVFGAAWEVLKANASVEGGKMALKVQREFDSHEEEEE